MGGSEKGRGGGGGGGGGGQSKRYKSDPEWRQEINEREIKPVNLNTVDIPRQSVLLCPSPPPPPPPSPLSVLVHHLVLEWTYRIYWCMVLVYVRKEDRKHVN